MAKAPPRIGSNAGAPRKWAATSHRSRQARGYGRQWEHTRARILSRDRHLCQPCLKAGRATPATEVDHITPRAQGGGEEDGNLQAICNPCHKFKTAHEGQAGRR